MRIPSLSDLVSRAEPEQAVSFARSAVRKLYLLNREPHVPAACLELGRALQRANCEESAQLAFRRCDQLRRALRLADYRSAYRAVRSSVHKPTETVSESARSAASEEPNNAFARRLLAEVLERMGEISAAESDLQSALAQDPELPGGFVALSRLLARLGRVSDAVSAARKAVAFDPDDPCAKQQLDDVVWLEKRNLVNVALGKRAEQSSVSRWSQPDDACGAVTGIKRGSYGFHTNFEDAPWWMLDLSKAEMIVAIRVFNRDDGYAAAAIESLTIALSNDCDGPWQEVYSGGRVFGGIRSGEPLFVSLDQPLKARYVKLQLRCHGALHVDEVEVFSTYPEALNVLHEASSEVVSL